MRYPLTFISLLLTPLVSCADITGDVLVLGATGRTGSLLYHELKTQNVNVRGLVRDVDKAREILDCTACDETEGIYQGDIRNLTSLLPAFTNVQTVAIATGVSGRGNPSPDFIKEIEFGGVQNAVRALAQDINIQSFGGVENLRVVLCSSRGTTSPPSDSGSSVFGNVLFYKLNAEAFLGSVGLVTSIVKPCGLSNQEGRNRTLLPLHDDSPTPTGSQMIPRADVARVMAALVARRPDQNLRFDLCSIEGPATNDLDQLIDSSKWNWQQIDAIKSSNVETPEGQPPQKRSLLQQVASTMANTPARFIPPK